MKSIYIHPVSGTRRTKLLQPNSKVAKPFISPTRKRTEGRAPVWGSEFTSKDTALQGGSSSNRS